MSDVDKVLEVLEARRSIYETKEASAYHANLEPSYDRCDLFNQKREAMEWAIDEVRIALGLPAKYGTG